MDETDIHTTHTHFTGMVGEASTGLNARASVHGGVPGQVAGECSCCPYHHLCWDKFGLQSGWSWG